MKIQRYSNFKRGFLVSFFTMLLCTACTFDEKPEFVEIAHLEVQSASIDEIVLKAEAVFKNENDLGGSLQTEDLEVFVDEVHVASVSSEEFKVPAKDRFTVPLTVKFPTSKLLEDSEGGLLGSLLKQVLKQKVEVNFKGNLKYKVIGFSSTYAVDHTEEINIEF